MKDHIKIFESIYGKNPSNKSWTDLIDDVVVTTKNRDQAFRLYHTVEKYEDLRQAFLKGWWACEDSKKTKRKKNK